MNRRNFLKLTGLAMAVPAMPVANPEMKFAEIDSWGMASVTSTSSLSTGLVSGAILVDKVWVELTQQQLRTFGLINVS